MHMLLQLLYYTYKDHLISTLIFAYYKILIIINGSFTYVFPFICNFLWNQTLLNNYLINNSNKYVDLKSQW